MTDAIAWVPDELLVQIEGDDARTWLNGQTTNDLKALSPEHPVYGLILNVKGRILADALAIDHPEHGVMMAVPTSAWPVLAPHLEHYIIMEDVALKPREDLALITVQRTSRPEGEGWLPHARLEGEGFDKVVSRAELASILAGLPGRVIDDGALETLRIGQGRPRFARDFGEATYPQEAGLETNAISFNKGCYLGQEVVCMLESRGKLSRRLVRLEGPSMKAGDALHDDAGEKIGEVTSAVDHEGRSLALGFVKRAHATEGTSVRAPAGEAKVIALATL